MQYGEDVGVLTQVDMIGNNQVGLYLAIKEINGVDHLRLMDSQGNEFVGGPIANIQAIGGALSNYLRAMGLDIDDIASDYATISEPLFRLPSSGRFDPVGFRYSGNQISYTPVMSRMSEGDEFAVFVSGVYVLNRLERSGSTLVYRTYVLPCNPAVQDSGLVYGYEGSYNTGFDIKDTISCDGNLPNHALSDWWNESELPHQFEQRVYYTDRIRLMPLLFIEY